MTINSDDMNPKNHDVPFPLDRKTLFELVWSMPMTSLAEKCGVSSSYLARVCTQMRVPRPERGYWAKLAAGKKVTKPDLPEPGPEDLLEWNKGEGITQSLKRRIKPDTTHKPRAIRRSKGSWHPLVRDAKELFLKGKETENGYLRPNKKILPDLLVSSEGLEKLLKLASSLYWCFEEKGHRVVFEPKHLDYIRPSSERTIEPEASSCYTTYWSPYRSTLVYVGDVAIGLMLLEVSEEVESIYDSSTHQYMRAQKNKGNSYRYSWTTKRYLPTGKFAVIVYSPYPGTKWEKHWPIPSARGSRELIENIARETIAAAPAISKLHVEAVELAEKRRRQWEIERQEYKRAERERLRLKSIEDSKLLLKDIIDLWGEAERIRSFFDQAEQVVTALDVSQRNELMARIEAARRVIGQNNALDALRSWSTPEELLDELITTRSSWLYDDS